MATALEKLRQIGQQIKAGNNPFQTPLFKPAEEYKTSTPMPSSTPTQATTPKPPANNVPMPPIANAATKPGSTPALGFGGAQYGENVATNKAISANETKLKIDPNFRASEIARSQSVISNLQSEIAKNPSNPELQKRLADAQKYLQVNLGYDGLRSDQQVPMPAPVTDPGAFTPTPMPSDPIATPTPAIPTMDWDAIQRYADGQIAAELARQRSAADQAINAGKLTAEQQQAALRQAAERLRGQVTEQRGIENVENARRLNPFSGRSDFALGMIERERGQTDRQLLENQQMQEANIQANLAQLQNQINAGYLALEQTSGAERDRIMQQLRESERQYDMQLAQLDIDRQLANSSIRNTDFNQQLSTWGANRSAFEFDQNFGLQEGQLTGTYKGQPTLARQQFDYQQQRDSILDQRWQQEFDEGRQRYGDEWAYQKARDSIKDEQWKTEFDEDVRRYGLDLALRRAEVNASIENMRADNARQAANQSSGGSSGGSSSGGSLTPNQVMGNITSRYTVPVYETNQYGERVKVGEKLSDNPKDREQMFLDIVDSVSNDETAMQMMRSLGMTQAEIEMYTRKYS